MDLYHEYIAAKSLPILHCSSTTSSWVISFALRSSWALRSPTSTQRAAGASAGTGEEATQGKQGAEVQVIWCGGPGLAECGYHCAPYTPTAGSSMVEYFVKYLD